MKSFILGSIVFLAAMSGAAQASSAFDCSSDSLHVATVVLLSSSEVEFILYNQVPGQIHNVLGGATVLNANAVVSSDTEVFGNLVGFDGNPLPSNENLGSIKLTFSDASHTVLTKVESLDLNGSSLLTYQGCLKQQN